MGSIWGSIRPYWALLAASTPQRDKNRARLTKFLRFDPAQCELDRWFEEEIQPRLRGKAGLIRYADDFVRHEARYVHGARAPTAGS